MWKIFTSHLVRSVLSMLHKLPGIPDADLGVFSKSKLYWYFCACVVWLRKTLIQRFYPQILAHFLQSGAWDSPYKDHATKPSVLAVEMSHQFRDGGWTEHSKHPAWRENDTYMETPPMRLRTTMRNVATIMLHYQTSSAVCPCFILFPTTIHSSPSPKYLQASSKERSRRWHPLYIGCPGGQWIAKQGI